MSEELLRSAAEVEFTKVALTRLAEDYSNQNETAAHQAVVAIRKRLDEFTPRTGLPPELNKDFQRRFMEVSAESPVEATAVLQEWWEALFRHEVDPAAAVAPMLIQLMLSAGSSTARMIMHHVGVKLATCETRHGVSLATQEVGTFLAVGVEQAGRGEPLWPQDHDLHRPDACPSCEVGEVEISNPAWVCKACGHRPA